MSEPGPDEPGITVRLHGGEDDGQELYLPDVTRAQFLEAQACIEAGDLEAYPVLYLDVNVLAATVDHLVNDPQSEEFNQLEELANSGGSDGR